MDISQSITYHITRTGNILRRLAAKKIRDAGLDVTPEESVFLNQLWDRDEQSLSELGRWSVKEPSTLTRQIDGLVKKGYVVREVNPVDRRSVFVRLTPAGKALKKRFEHTGIRQLDRDLAHALGGNPEKLLRELLDICQTAERELRGE
ncbi:MarR family winged helix-turn-helix transcriptional regulator [Parahaliea mediterranea]|uniref:MarR family transcriptional regulator n=1 Tax=Parahaliea mediterranea TaxID=651086 RepID=A0A939IIY9_9GAMM|nr:MarR family transcriptional regulator [Parahaliea mediterranea]MBN7795736.1 MarR family transcriptional regulator [Parahaliea mediterranea]